MSGMIIMPSNYVPGTPLTWQYILKNIGLWSLWYYQTHGDFSNGRVPLNIPWVTKSENFGPFEEKYKEWRIRNREKKLERILNEG